MTIVVSIDQIVGLDDDDLLDNFEKASGELAKGDVSKQFWVLEFRKEIRKRMKGEN